MDTYESRSNFICPERLQTLADS